MEGELLVRDDDVLLETDPPFLIDRGYVVERPPDCEIENNFEKPLQRTEMKIKKRHSFRGPGRMQKIPDPRIVPPKLREFLMAEDRQKIRIDHSGIEIAVGAQENSFPDIMIETKPVRDVPAVPPLPQNLEIKRGQRAGKPDPVFLHDEKKIDVRAGVAVEDGLGAGNRNRSQIWKIPQEPQYPAALAEPL